jgi:hypothetical protein
MNALKIDGPGKLEKEVGKSVEVGLKPIKKLGDAYGTQKLANEMKDLLKTKKGRKKVSKANDYKIDKEAAFSMRSPQDPYNTEKIEKISYKERLKKFKMEQSKNMANLKNMGNLKEQKNVNTGQQTPRTARSSPVFNLSSNSEKSYLKEAENMLKKAAKAAAEAEAAKAAEDAKIEKLWSKKNGGRRSTRKRRRKRTNKKIRRKTRKKTKRRNKKKKKRTRKRV